MSEVINKMIAKIVVCGVLMILVLSEITLSVIIAVRNTNNCQVNEEDSYQQMKDEEQLKFLQEYSRKQEEKRKRKNETHNKRNGTPKSRI